MKRKTVELVVVVESSLTLLERNINNYLFKGFQLRHKMFITMMNGTYHYHQVMVKKE